QEILAVESEDYFLAIVDAIDPNQDEPLGFDELVKLAQSFKNAADKQEDVNVAQDWRQLSVGITEGLKSFTVLE
ncbi:MAG: hypothetical protein ACFCAD_20355, partial [Pleurocapsa sp.]